MAANAAAGAGPCKSQMPRAEMTVAQRTREVTSRTLSHVAYRGHLTRAVNTGGRLAATSALGGASETLLIQLQSAHNRMVKYREYVIASAQWTQHYDDQTEDQMRFYEDLIATDLDRSEDAHQALILQIARMEDALRPPPPPPPQVGGRPPPPQKVAQDLRPKVLTREAQPVELKVWLTRFRAYYAASRMADLDLLIQQEYFRHCLDDYLVERLESKILNATTIIDPIRAGDATCLTMLTEEFLVFHPMYTRRLQFFRASCAPGQSVSQWASSLRRLGDEAQIDGMIAEDLYVMRYLTGIPDPILSELLKIDEPSQAKFDQCITQFEQSTAFRATVPTSAMAAYGQTGAKPKRATKGKASQPPKQPQPQPQQPQQQKRQQPAAGNRKGTSSSPIGQKMDAMRNAGQCTRCGSRQQGHTCNYSALQCQKCGRSGHISSVCLGHLRPPPPTANSAQPGPDFSQFPPLPAPIRQHYDDGSVYSHADGPQSYSVTHGQQ